MCRLMAEFAPEIAQTLRCPTCNASQTWSDECRRCKSDLRLLRRVIQDWQRHCERSLQALSEGRTFAALTEAQRAYELYPDEFSQKLLASCHLVNDSWPAAIQLARQAK